MTARTSRDEWGMPRISADAEEDGFFALGYAQAEDRLHGILRNQLFVEGRLAGLLGPEALAADVSARCWRHAEAAAAMFERLSAPLQANYRAFAAGIAAYSADHPERVPEWAPDVAPWLPCGFPRAALWQPFMIHDAAVACLRGGVEPDPELVGELHSVLAPVSNEWVLMPSRTASGAAILLSDPHGPISDFAQVFEFALRAGALDCSGVALLGCALPLLGFTRHLAWGYTTGGPQVSDCYRVPADMKLRARTVTIDVLGEAAQQRTFEYASVNGVESPVIARDDRSLYVACTSYADAHVPSLDEQVYRWLTARDVAEFRRAMEPLAQFPQNTMAADVHGNALYIRTGRTPTRAAGVDPSTPVEWSRETEWQGLHPLDDLVEIRNPRTGFMQNCNVGPDTMVGLPVPVELEPSSYPPYIYNDRPRRSHSRGDRALELLARVQAASVDDALAIALDMQWPFAQRWVEALRDAVQEEQEPRSRILEQLLAFDGQARAESEAALAYVFWRSAVAWPPDGDTDAARGLVERVDAGGTLGSGDRRALIDAAARAFAEVARRFGEAPVAYGDVFRVGTPDRSEPAVGGVVWTHVPARDYDFEDVTRAMDAPLRLFHVFSEPDADGHRYALAGGRSLRLTVLGNPVESYTVVLWGQNEVPGSEHYNDQARLASESRVRRVSLD